MQVRKRAAMRATRATRRRRTTRAAETWTSAPSSLSFSHPPLCFWRTISKSPSIHIHQLPLSFWRPTTLSRPDHYLCNLHFGYLLLWLSWNALVWNISSSHKAFFRIRKSLWKRIQYYVLYNFLDVLLKSRFWMNTEQAQQSTKPEWPPCFHLLTIHHWSLMTHQWWVIWRRHKKKKWEVKLESGTMSALSMCCTRPPHRSTCARVDDPATGVLSSFVLLHHCHCVVITSVIQAWFTIKKFTSKLSVQVRLIWNNEKWVFLKKIPYNYRCR